MFPTLIRRAAQRAPRSDPAYMRRMLDLPPPKKVWPPDFKKLSVQEQLRFEKKFKRRLALASARPRWEKFVKVAQLFAIVSVLTYSVLFMDWGNDHHAIDGVRQGFWNFFGYDYESPSARPQEQKNSRGIPQAK